MNQGVGVGLGRATRSTNSRRKSMKIGIASGGQYYYCHPSIADGPCLHLCGLCGLRTC